MARSRVTISGAAALRTKLFELRRGVESGAERGQAGASEAIASDWRAEVPVDTGEYQNSIGADEDGAAATARHAPFVEFGTSTRPAQPAGAVAAEAARSKMPRQVADAVRREL